MTALVGKLHKLLAHEIQLLGYELWGIVHVPQGRQSLFRIYIEKPEGVTLQDCEKVNRMINAILAVEDPIHGSYRLEVSSPGSDRPLFELAHYQRFVGSNIKLKLYAPINGRRNFVGKLLSVEDNKINIEVDGQELAINFVEIERASIVPEC